MGRQTACVCKGLINSVTFHTYLWEPFVLPANLKTDWTTKKLCATVSLSLCQMIHGCFSKHVNKAPKSASSKNNCKLIFFFLHHSKAMALTAELVLPLFSNKIHAICESCPNPSVLTAFVLSLGFPSREQKITLGFIRKSRRNAIKLT